MRSTVMPLHEGLGMSGRFRPIGWASPRITVAELGVLLFLGAVAAVLSTLVKLNLGLPGHNIIRVIFPMALGLALVPRRGSALIMGAGGVAAAAMILLVRWGGSGAGAITSLALTGVLLDLALLGARNGRAVYVRLTLAGLAANLAAFLIRGGTKFLSGGLVDGLPLDLWWPKAVLSYPLCGLLAGLLSAAVWFRVTAHGRPPSGGETAP